MKEKSLRTRGCTTDRARVGSHDVQYYMYEVCDAGARWAAADGADKGHEALMVRMFLVKYGDAVANYMRCLSARDRGERITR